MQFLAALATLFSLSIPQTETAKLLPSNGSAGDEFGCVVAVDGVLAVVGARHDDAPGFNSGSAHVFNTATNQWMAQLLASDAAERDEFGTSVGISGAIIVVGAPLKDDNGDKSGAAYLFDMTTGLEVAKLLPLDGASGDRFGISVAISGTFALVGAYQANDARGAAYVFDATTGMQLAKLQHAAPSVNDRLGYAVALSGTIALVGAPSESAMGTDSGAAYLFDIVTATQIGKLLPGDGASLDYFGSAVALDGPLALVGAFNNDDLGVNSGAAYLFDAVTAAQVLKLLAPDGGSTDNFGVSLAIQGTTAMVGARGNDDNGVGSGAAYKIDLASGSAVGKFLPSDGAPRDQFGSSVAMSGSTVLVGSYLDDDNGDGSGSAYLFDAPGSSGDAFCAGDGLGAPCPCGANGNAGEGCLNSTGVSGASLRGNGTVSISNDSFWLEVSGAPANKPGLLLRGGNQSQGGMGAPMGDGLLCTTSQSARSQVQITVGGTTTFTDFQGGAFGAWSFGPATHTYYQFWYRDPQNTCSGLGFNFSNAWAVLWLP